MRTATLNAAFGLQIMLLDSQVPPSPRPESRWSGLSSQRGSIPTGVGPVDLVGASFLIYLWYFGFHTKLSSRGPGASYPNVSGLLHLAGLLCGVYASSLELACARRLGLQHRLCRIRACNQCASPFHQPNICGTVRLYASGY